MAAANSQKLMAEPEGESPEEIAWALLEWIRRVENADNRNSLLDAYQECLAVVREGASAAASALSPSSTGSQRRLAYKMTLLVATGEGRDPGQRNQGDRKWILDAFAECLATLTDKRVPRPLAPVLVDTVAVAA